MDKFLQNNWVMKAGAVLIAFMLWMIVNLDQQPESAFSNQAEDQLTIDNVHVEAIYDEELYVLVEMDDRVQVLLSGRRALLNLNVLRQEPYRVFADMSELGAGEHMVELQYEGFPAELEVSIVPQRVRVVLEEKEFRTFGAEIELTGSVPDGYTVGELTVTPDQVQVIAPPSDLERVGMVRGYLNLNNATESFQEEVALRVYDIGGQELEAEVSPSTVTVDVPIISPNASVPVELVLVNELPDGTSLIGVSTNTERVRVFGHEDAVRDLSSITVEVDLSEFEQSRIVSYDIPGSDQWIQVEPDQVEVDVRVGPTSERVLSNVPLVIDGPDDGYIYTIRDSTGETIEDGRMSVTVLGSFERLQQLSSSDIELYVDLSGLDSGTHALQVQVTLPDSMYYKVDDLFVEVDISAEEDDDD